MLANHIDFVVLYSNRLISLLKLNVRNSLILSVKLAIRPTQCRPSVKMKLTLLFFKCIYRPSLLGVAIYLHSIKFIL